MSLAVPRNPISSSKSSSSNPHYSDSNQSVKMRKITDDEFKDLLGNVEKYLDNEKKMDELKVKIQKSEREIQKSETEIQKNEKKLEAVHKIQSANKKIEQCDKKLADIAAQKRELLVREQMADKKIAEGQQKTAQALATLQKIFSFTVPHFCAIFGFKSDNQKDIIDRYFSEEREFGGLAIKQSKPVVKSMSTIVTFSRENRQYVQCNFKSFPEVNGIPTLIHYLEEKDCPIKIVAFASALTEEELNGLVNVMMNRKQGTFKVILTNTETSKKYEEILVTRKSAL